MNLLNLLVDVLTAPGAAFARLRERAPVLFPVLLLLGATIAFNAVYFSLVDPAFLAEQFVEQADEPLSEERRERIEAFAQGQDRGLLPIIGSAIGLLVMLLVHGGYFSLVSMFSGYGVRYRQWLGFVSWASMPALLTIIGGFAALMLAPGYELSLREINPLSLGSLANLEGGGMNRLLGQIDLAQVWTLVLLSIGFRVWTDATWGRSVVVAAIPYGLVYGISAAFII